MKILKFSRANSIAFQNMDDKDFKVLVEECNRKIRTMTVFKLIRRAR